VYLLVRYYGDGIGSIIDENASECVSCHQSGHVWCCLNRFWCLCLCWL